MRRTAHWQVPVALAAASIAAELGGTTLRGLLRFDREAIANGELWRLLTGHFVHLGVSHMLLNVGAMMLIWLLVGQGLNLHRWLMVIAACLAGIDLAFWYFDPQLSWYVGLSGLLHGMLAAGLVAQFRVAPRESLVLGCLLAGKIVYEQVAGAMPGSEFSAGGPVVVNAHLYGAIAGLVSGLLLRGRDRASEPI
jgi:rhomboid family GlyGly-CTERM serine protease